MVAAKRIYGGMELATRCFAKAVWYSCLALWLFSSSLSAYDRRWDELWNALNKTLEKIGNNRDAAKAYLEYYVSRGLVDDSVTSEEITLTQFKMNESTKVFLASAGEEILCEFDYLLDPARASYFGYYRVVMGFDTLGPSAIACSASGLAPGRGHARFTLKAPERPGLYSLRFRTVNKYLEVEALHGWFEKNHEEPKPEATVGLVYVLP